MPTATGCMPRFQDPAERTSDHHHPELSDSPERADHPGRLPVAATTRSARAAALSSPRTGRGSTRLREAGVTPEDIDIVLCTHLHVDHVGWNTRLENGRWVPTFPNARYLIAQREWDYWRTAGPAALVRTGDFITDSVLPIFDSGQADLIGDEHAIASDIAIEAAPGHTPGQSMVRLGGGGERSASSVRRPDAPSVAASLSGMEHALLRRSRRRRARTRDELPQRARQHRAADFPDAFSEPDRLHHRARRHGLTISPSAARPSRRSAVARD